jgi:hypothetical protein
VTGKYSVSLYPQAALPETEEDAFWDRLQDTLARVASGEFIMLGRDLNEHVGSGSDGYEGLHGVEVLARGIKRAGGSFYSVSRWTWF